MAKTSMVIKAKRLAQAVKHRLSLGLDPKPGQAVRQVNRCGICGRPHGYMRKFDMCRICFRERARRGEIMGIKKSSW